MGLEYEQAYKHVLDLWPSLSNKDRLLQQLKELLVKQLVSRSPLLQGLQWLATRLL